MTIGINAIAAFKNPRTGVEEYVYQLIKNLAKNNKSKGQNFVLYSSDESDFDFKLPSNFKIKKLKWPLPMWTQTRLSIEMIRNKPEVFFIPVHVIPFIHPANSIATIHGLEYEYYPEMYPLKHLRYLRWSTKYALKKARKIIAVSENTKKDLINLYKADSEKIKVVYHGVHFLNPKIKEKNKKKYILFLGRIEEKKNVQGLIKAFQLLKKKYQIPHKLILVGPKGYQAGEILKEIKNNDIVYSDYVPEDKKMLLLKQAEMFVLPSFYEGFGMPVLEAQAAGCPVITSDVSSLPEVAGEGAVLINPKNIEELSGMMRKIIDDNDFKKRLITQGKENIKRFSWGKCAQETLNILLE